MEKWRVASNIVLVASSAKNLHKSKIKMITWIEHIRKRPGMFIGDLRLTGFKTLLEYFFEELLADNFQDPIVEIKFYKNCRLELNIKNIETQKTISRINELNENNEKLNSYGLAGLVSLNDSIKIIVNNFPKKLTISGRKGSNKINEIKTKDKNNSISIDFTLDKEIFKEFEIIYEQLNDFLRQFAYLNPTLKIVSIDNSCDDEQKNVFYYKKGIFNQLDYIISQQNYSNTKSRLEINTKVGEFTVKIGICYSTVWFEKSIIKTYANNTETYLGGSFKDGIINGLIIAIKNYAEKNNTKISLTKNSVIDQLILVAAIRGNDLEFTGSVRRKLGMPALQKKIKTLVFDEMTKYLLQEPQIAERIVAKFELEDDCD